MNYGKKAQRKSIIDKGITHRNEKIIYGNELLRKLHEIVRCRKEHIPLSHSDYDDRLSSTDYSDKNYSTVIEYKPKEKSAKDVITELCLIKSRDIIDIRYVVTIIACIII